MNNRLSPLARPPQANANRDHVVHIEQPEHCAAALGEFLNDKRLSDE
jgi:hypothetical protein